MPCRKKDDYAKLGFSTQNIKSHITDPRCINAKLTPLQLFKAAFQLGDIPAVSNFRFMKNPASKDDGKYREWMYHFDNSNYAAEFKLITTRIAGTEQDNNEQCLAAFPYDTEKTIRFTQSEAATKFPTMADLQKEFGHIPGARYVVIHNPDSTTPIETGIRTEMIVHHRSASGKNETESRDAELMTFHGTDRCQPFLTSLELERATHLTSLQRFVLGEFRDAKPQQFVAALKEEKETLHAQIRQSLMANALKPLEKITVAKFSEQGLQITDEALFTKQLTTYDNLPEVLDKLPKLELSSADLTEKVLTIVPMLMNYDQNTELKPDCSENKAFPARTQLQERTNEQFREPLKSDLQHIQNNMIVLLGAQRALGFAEKVLQASRKCLLDKLGIDDSNKTDRHARLYTELESLTRFYPNDAQFKPNKITLNGQPFIEQEPTRPYFAGQKVITPDFTMHRAAQEQ